MEAILTNKSTSINKVKISPTTEINELNDDAAAIYNRSKVSAYLVSKKRFKELYEAEIRCEELEEQVFMNSLVETANERLNDDSKFIEVSMDELYKMCDD